MKLLPAPDSLKLVSSVLPAGDFAIPYPAVRAWYPRNSGVGSPDELHMIVRQVGQGETDLFVPLEWLSEFFGTRISVKSASSRKFGVATIRNTTHPYARQSVVLGRNNDAPVRRDCYSIGYLSSDDVFHHEGMMPYIADTLKHIRRVTRPEYPDDASLVSIGNLAGVVSGLCKFYGLELRKYCTCGLATIIRNNGSFPITYPPQIVVGIGILHDGKLAGAIITSDSAGCDRPDAMDIRRLNVPVLHIRENIAPMFALDMLAGFFKTINNRKGKTKCQTIPNMFDTRSEG